MTRRERLEAKLEKREEWADKADARSTQRYETAHRMAEGIPLGQPILVGHHSEKRDRNYRARIHSNMDKACEEAALAKHHEAKAGGLSAQLERSVFSDDTDAIEELEKRIAAREAQADFYKRVNAAWKKAEGADKAAKLATLVKAGVLTQAQAEDRAVFFGRCHWEDKPFPSYASTNLRGNIRRDKERVEEVKRRQARTAEAEAAPNGVAVVDCGTSEYDGVTYVRVTFAEKPEREILDALRAAGFSWGGGSWVGSKAKLPESVKAA